jgi:hypothetical protein
MTSTTNNSPTIHRCGQCGGLVHPSGRSTSAAWCRRCGRIVDSTVDGGSA